MIQLLAAYAAKSALLLLAAAGVARWGARASAAWRHLIWTVAATAMLALLPASLALPAVKLGLTSAGSAGPVASILLLLWLSVALALLGRIAVQQVRLARFGAASLPIEEGPLEEAARQAAAAFGIRRRVRLGIGPERMPGTFGLFRPIVLLPGDAFAWEPERLRATLLHEMGHVARLDAFTLLVGALGKAIHWFNPLAWTAANALRKEAELACDQLVLAAGAPGTAYARILLATAREGATDKYRPSGWMVMASAEELEARLEAVLSSREAARTSRLQASVLIAAAAATTLMLAPLRAESVDGYDMAGRAETGS